MSDDMIEQQKLKEKTMVEKGVVRFHNQMDAATRKSRHLDLVPFSTVLNKMTTDLVPHIKQLQREVRTRLEATLKGEGGTSKSQVNLHLAALDPIMVSYVTVRTILQEQGCTTHTLAARIAGVLQMQCQLELMSAQEGEAAKDEGRRNRIKDLKKTVKAINPATIKKWMVILDDLDKLEWAWEERVRIGMTLIHLVERGLSEYVTIQTVRRMANRRSSWRTEVVFTDRTNAHLKAQEELKANESPWLVPMIAPPRDFTPTEDGGYYHIKHDMVKDNVYGVRTDKAAVYPQAVCDAVNKIGNVAWRINRRLLEHAENAIQQGCEEILPVAPLRPLPEPIEEAVWATLSKAQRGKHKTDRRVVHDHNNKLESKRESMRRVIQIADEHVNYGSLYMPHTLDFRGRMYPLPQDLNIQGDDFTRSLLEFSAGKPVGPDGMGWVCHAVAAAYGEDKMTLIDQITWCEVNAEALRVVALDPLGVGYEFLCGADKPWAFLAACMALEDAYEGKPSHLPVHVDGTCNGLQHLSAMGLDSVGGTAVNLVDGPRQDIYQEVADKVIANVAVDTSGSARNWAGHISRKTVKRAVMTTPYGVTPEGIRTQLISDGHLEGIPGEPLPNASYMRDQLGVAIKSTIVKGKAIMFWMQNATKILCEENKAVTWTTPIGFICRQAYHKPDARRMSTLAGYTRVVVPNHTGELRLNKQVNSIAPNIVHSFDAAHLMMTVNSVSDLDVGCVHDSFATHSCDIPVLAKALRETFVKIYSDDQLEKLKHAFIQSAGREETWMTPPERGDLDIRDVLTSTYFFF